MIAIPNKKHATNDNTSGTVSLVYLVTLGEAYNLGSFALNVNDLQLLVQCFLLLVLHRVLTLFPMLSKRDRLLEVIGSFFYLNPLSSTSTDFRNIESV